MTIQERNRTAVGPEIDPALEDELLARYRGKWVAMTSSRLIAVGATASEVYQAAVDQGHDSPIVYYVPENQNTAYIL